MVEITEKCYSAASFHNSTYRQQPTNQTNDVCQRLRRLNCGYTQMRV